ncbi:MAG: hypothetical protein ACP5MD_09595, partial [Verrucomicrobiia bacterium]
MRTRIKRIPVCMLACSLAASLATTGGDYSGLVLTDKPVHYWPLAEATPDMRAADLGSPGGQPGLYTSDTGLGITLQQSTAPLQLGPAALFDGSPGTYVDLGLFHPGDS